MDNEINKEHAEKKFLDFAKQKFDLAIQRYLDGEPYQILNIEVEFDKGHSHAPYVSASICNWRFRK